MKRAWKSRLPSGLIFICESERSGDPRREFHTVGKRLKVMTHNT